MTGFNLASRVTALKAGRPNLTGLNLEDPERSLWILRDDELGGFWGTKYRKYASIIEHCQQENISEIICTGGINSNNLAAASLLCKEFGINVTVLAIEDHVSHLTPPTGNRLIIKTALSPERLILIPRSEKNTVMERMSGLSEQLRKAGKKTLILEDGGGCIPAVKGCLTLANEILRDRGEWPDKKPPDHVFIDSGTGLTSASLVAGIKLRAPTAQIKTHVVQMAGFDEQIKNAFDSWVTPATGVQWDDVHTMMKVYRPLSPRSYGATSAALFEFIRELARTFGILSDPVYTAKLFARTFDLISGQNLKGKILIIHSGGISGLLGYSQNLEALD